MGKVQGEIINSALEYLRRKWGNQGLDEILGEENSCILFHSERWYDQQEWFNLLEKISVKKPNEKIHIIERIGHYRGRQRPYKDRSLKETIDHYKRNHRRFLDMGPISISEVEQGYEIRYEYNMHNELHCLRTLGYFKGLLMNNLECQEVELIEEAELCKILIHQSN